MATIEVKNDYMLGRQNETILYQKCIELEIRIDKAIDFINEWEKYTKEKRPLEVSMLDLLYIKEILGEKENE